MSTDDKLTKYEELIARCDLLIKDGKISEVIDILSQVNLAGVPRILRQSLAKTCRRVDLVSHGLRLLQPIIRNEKLQIEPATPGEISEYSVLLSRNGSRQEAISLLEKVKADVTPEASLYLAYCHISNWDYGKATGLLELFLKSAADDYSKLIARVNLIAAYLAVSQMDSAEELLATTIPLAESAGAARLVGNCYELRARLFLHRGNFSESRADLDRSLKIFTGSQSYDRLFIDKWQAVMAALEQNSVDPLVEFRKQAVANKEWESVREVDLYIVKIQFEQRLLDYVLFGTPMESFRQRILTETNRRPSDHFVFGQSGHRCLDLKTGSMDQGDFNSGKKMHRVITALVRDFYAPRNIGTLFAEICPDEYFDVNSSSRRVKQLLLRTRQWFKENKIPATIEQNDGSYRLAVEGPFGFIIPLESGLIDSNSMQWKQLESKFPIGIRFSAKQACEALNWPRSSFLLIIDWALKTGRVGKYGQGKATFYQVMSESPSVSSGDAA
jgi:tetratricopeptide (TPR) repeat protein